MSDVLKEETYERFLGGNVTTPEEKVDKVKKSLAKVVVYFENFNVRKIEEKPHYDVSISLQKKKLDAAISHSRSVHFWETWEELCL